MIIYNGKGESLFNTATVERKPTYIRATGDMGNGDKLTLGFNNCAKNNHLVFIANIDTFNQLKVGRDVNYHLLVDSTNIYLYSGTTLKKTYPHGLTIENNIQVMIVSHATDGNADITLISNGNVFEQKDIVWSWVGCPFAESVESTMTDCVLSWTSKDLDAPIWIFGDSYCNINSNARWTHYLIQNGFGARCMIAQQDGSYSKTAMQSFRTLIEIGNPKYIIYTLGMNESDISTAINGGWREAILKLKTVCAERGIELILSTTPNVPTYSIHNFKNAFVEESGFRYIDFAKAVNAEGTDREWWDGLLENDGTGVHPTEAGAKVLYMQALADFPELMG